MSWNTHDQKNVMQKWEMELANKGRKPKYESESDEEKKFEEGLSILEEEGLKT